MRSIAWFEREFQKIYEDGRLPSIIERLEGTPTRIKSKIKNVGEPLLTLNLAGKWSIKEEIGHMLDLEPLWFNRVNDILSGKEVLQEADLTNQKTFEANHNNKQIQEILSGFKVHRRGLIHKLNDLHVGDLEKSALHPRLKTPMRIVDLCYFVAEHDDHHISHISFILNSKRG